MANNGRFKKGQSGNPGGRPKVVADIKALAQEQGEDAIKGLALIAKDTKAPAQARVAAYNALLDRGFGKPETKGELKTEFVDNVARLPSAPASIEEWQEQHAPKQPH